MTRQLCSCLQRWEAEALRSAAALFRPTLSGNNRRELDVKMVRALTLLSRWAAAWIPLLPGAITGAVLRALPSPTLRLFTALAGERRASLLCSEASAMRPYWRKRGPDDCLRDGTVAMATDSTCTGYVHNCCLGAGRLLKLSN